MPRLSLSTKLLGTFILVLLPMLGLLLYNARENLQQRQQVILDNQLLTAQAVAVQVDQSFDAAIGIGWAVADDPLAQTMDPAVLDPHLRTLVRENPTYDFINVFDAQGVNRGWGHLTEPAEPRLVIADRAFFQKVMATNAPVISDVLLLRRPTMVGLVASVPIRGSDGKPIGVVNVVMRTDQLARYYVGTHLQPGQAIFLADPTGRLGFHTGRPNLPYDESNAYADFGPLKQALAGTPTTVAEFTGPVTGDVRLGAFAPTPKYRWAVGVTMPTDVALAPVREALRSQMVAFAAIVALSAILAAVLARLLVAPVRRLEQQARALGAGDLTRRVDIRTGDELEQLGNAFNRMAAQLQERQADVQRLRAEAERRAGQLEAVIASMSDGVFICDAEGRLTDANPAALRLLGDVDRSELGHLPDYYRQRYHLRYPDGRPMEPGQTPLELVASGQTFSDLEMRLRSPEGRELLVTASGAPVRDETGRIVLGVVVLRNITEERRRQLELEALVQIGRALASELELRRVAEVAIDQGLRVQGVDAAGLWLANPARRELTLLASRHLLPETVERFSHFSYDAPYLAALAARTEQTQAIEDLLAPGVPPELRKVGEAEGWRSLLAVPLRSRGHLVGVVTYAARAPHRFTPRDAEFAATTADVFAVAIENANLYDELRESLRLREEFLAAAAHELRTPVTTIKGWADLLLRMDSPSPREKKALENIGRQTGRIIRLIEDMLATVRLRPGPLALRRERLDLNDLVRARADQTARTTEPGRFKVETDGPLVVEADPELIGEVLGRLLENAIRYSPPGTPIEVQTRRVDGEAVVSVTDHGAGIPPERQPHVFQPFYEAVPSGEPGYVGIVSLGLYLSKLIVEAHGGHIWFTSAPGKGSTFSFSLPLA